MKRRQVENINMSTDIYVSVVAVLLICYFCHGVSFNYRLCNGPKKKKYVENGGSGTSPVQHEA